MYNLPYILIHKEVKNNLPFVKNINSKHIQPYSKSTSVFVGRKNELDFFSEDILRPDYPSHNIISISGQGGVGKTTLVRKFIDQIQQDEFKYYCFACLVDERQTTIISIMEKFAEQLDLTGEFEKALNRYNESLRNLQNERNTLHEATLRKATTEITGSVIKSVPVVGNILEQGVGLATGYLWDEIHYQQRIKDMKRLEDSVKEVTSSFVIEINNLAENYVYISKDKMKRKRRIVLIFDTYEQLAAEVSPWLLNYFMEIDISINIVLITAGRSSIERANTDDSKKWLQYTNDVIYQIFLESFTQEEVKQYLFDKGVFEPSQITTIWQRSRGLPLYLVQSHDTSSGTQR